MASVAMRPCCRSRALAADCTRIGRSEGAGWGGGEDDDLRDCYANLKHCSGANEPNEE